MLFNKDNNGQEELKGLLGFLYAANEFANIATDIELAEEEIIELIGKPVYDKAKAHYDGGPESELLDALVKHIQLPVAYYAVHSFSQHLDVSHGEDGRKVRIDNENEKIPWEWMIHKDDEAILNKAHKTTDRLIAFLESHANDITEWKDSPAQKEARSLFINTARIFDSIFPIDRSRRFFIKIIPFIREAERKYIVPVLTQAIYDAVKAAIQSGNLGDYAPLVPLVQVPLAFYTLAMAVQRLSVTMLPNGIFQEYITERQTMKANKPADISLRMEVMNNLKRTADLELDNLQKYLSKKAAEEAGETYEGEDLYKIDPDDKFVRL